MDQKLNALQRDQSYETEKLRKECQVMKESFNSRLESEYIPIVKHEEIMNLEFSQANERMQAQLRKLKDKVENDVALRLEEREL